MAAGKAVPASACSGINSQSHIKLEIEPQGETTLEENIMT
jgi:hypothetical protein